MSKARKSRETVSVTVALPLDLEESRPVDVLRDQLQRAMYDLIGGELPPESRRRAAIHALSALNDSLWQCELTAFNKPAQQAAEYADHLIRWKNEKEKAAIMTAIAAYGLANTEDERVRARLNRIRDRRKATGDRSLYEKRKGKRTKMRTRKR